MSTWSDEEARELQEKGNDYARRTWLKNAPPVGQNGRPEEGDNIDVFKRFVIDAYERKLYHGEDEGSWAATGSSNLPPPTVTAGPAAAPSKPKSKVSTIAPVRRKFSTASSTVITPAPAPPVVADLLDFTSTPNESIQSSGNNTTFQANFGDIFAPVTTTTTTTTTTTMKPTTTSSSTPANTAVPVVSSTSASTAIKNDPFQPNLYSSTWNANVNFTQLAAPFSASSGFTFIDDNNTSKPAPTMATTTTTPQPIMSNHTMSGNSSSISSMNMSAMTGNRSMGWNNQNNQHSFQNEGIGNMQQIGSMGMMQNQQMMMMMQQQQQKINNNTNPINGATRNNVMGSGIMNNNYNNNGSSMMNMNMMNTNMTSNGTNISTIMNQQQHNRNSNSNSNMNDNLKGSLNSLQMNMSSMHAWSSGLDK